MPSDVVWEGWGDSADDENGSSGFSWRGEALPFVPYKDVQRAFQSRGQPDAVPLRVPHDEGREENPERTLAAMIDLQAIGEPVYALGGDADMVWDSGGMTRKIAERRGELPTVALAYEDANHGLSGTAFRRATAGTAAARLDAWPKLVAFLDEHMSETACAGAREPAITASAAEAAYSRVDAAWFDRDLTEGSVAAALRDVMRGAVAGGEALVRAAKGLTDSPLKQRLSGIAVGEFEARYDWTGAGEAAESLGADDLASDWWPVRADWPVFEVESGGPVVVEVPLDGMSIPATLNGEAVSIILDTGAPGLGVDREVAERVGLKVDRSVASTSYIPSFGLALPKHPALIDTLEIGGVTMRNVPANTGGTVPDDQREAYERMRTSLAADQAIMGLDALRQAFDVVEFDYEEGVVRLIREDDTPTARPGFILGGGRKPVTPLTRNGETVNVYLDTGAYGHILGPDAADPACAPSRTFEQAWGRFTEYKVPLRLAGSAPFDAWVALREFGVDAEWDVTGVFGIPRSGVLRVDMEDRAVSLRDYDVSKAVYDFAPVATSPGAACGAAAD